MSYLFYILTVLVQSFMSHDEQSFPICSLCLRSCSDLIIQGQDPTDHHLPILKTESEMDTWKFLVEYTFNFEQRGRSGLHVSLPFSIPSKLRSSLINIFLLGLRKFLSCYGKPQVKFLPRLREEAKLFLNKKLSFFTSIATAHVAGWEVLLLGENISQAPEFS